MLGITVLGALAVLGLVWLVAWRSPPFYDAPPAKLPVPILSMDQYDSLSETHLRPYVVRIEAGSGALPLFGARHTKDPALRDEHLAAVVSISCDEGSGSSL